MTNNKKQEIFNFLDALRESGKINMFGSVPYICMHYPELSKAEARTIFFDWMATFGDRHPKS